MILSSHEEAALMCQLLNTTPEEILLHEGKDEKETAKCQADIKRVRELLEQAEQNKNEPVTIDELVPSYSILSDANKAKVRDYIGLLLRDQHND